MINFKKVLNYKILLIILFIPFIFISTLYSYPDAKDSLRTPSGAKRTYRRIETTMLRRTALHLLAVGGVALPVAAQDMPVIRPNSPVNTSVALAPAFNMPGESRLEELFLDASYSPDSFPAMKDAILTASVQLNLPLFKSRIEEIGGLKFSKPAEYMKQLRQILEGDSKSIGLVPLFVKQFRGYPATLRIFINGLNFGYDVFGAMQASDKIDQNRKAQIEYDMAHASKAQFLYFICAYLGLDAQMAFGPDGNLLMINNPESSEAFLVILLAAKDTGARVDTLYRSDYQRRGSYFILKDTSASGASVNVAKSATGDDEILVLKESRRRLYLYMLYLDSANSAQRKYTRSGTAAIYAAVAYVFTALGENSIALSACEEGMKVNPWLSVLYYNGGVAAGAMKDAANAGRYYDKALELNPFYAYAYNNRAAIYIEERNYLKGRELLEKAIEYDPGYSSGYFHLGQLYESVFLNYKMALVCYENAVKFNRERADFKAALNDTKRLIRRIEDAMGSLRKELNIPSDNTNKIRCLIAILAYRIGDTKTMTEFIKDADPLSVDFDTPSDWLNLGYIYYGMGEDEKSKECFRRAVAEDKNKLYAIPERLRPPTLMGSIISRFLFSPQNSI